ncbi:uncharacterized protein [Hyperolius riggenbachi]|uniref:uncharacterized protein n=1 Tax=Hyperolius riggenbachi TaxID=752182 RepID=UPI0035A3B995
MFLIVGYFLLFLHLSPAAEITSVRLLAGELYAGAGSRLLIPCIFSMDDLTHTNKISLEWRRTPGDGRAYTTFALLEDNSVDLVEKHSSQRTEFFISQFRQGNCSLVIDPLHSNDDGIYEPHIAIDGVQYQPTPSTAVYVWDNSEESGLSPVDTNNADSVVNLMDEDNIQTSTAQPGSTQQATDNATSVKDLVDDNIQTSTAQPDSTSVATTTVKKVEDQSTTTKADVTSGKVTTAQTTPEKKMPNVLQMITSAVSTAVSTAVNIRQKVTDYGAVIAFLLFFMLFFGWWCVWKYVGYRERLATEDREYAKRTRRYHKRQSLIERVFDFFENLYEALTSRRNSLIERAEELFESMIYELTTCSWARRRAHRCAFRCKRRCTRCLENIRIHAMEAGLLPKTEEDIDE